MPRPLTLRNDYDATQLRQLAQEADEPAQVRRLLALACVYDGMRRDQAARQNAMQAQTLCDWVHAFNAKGPEGLKSTPLPGRPRKLSPAQRQAIAQLVDDGPDPEVDGVARWRRADIQAIIERRYGVRLAVTTVGRLLKELGFAHVSARPRHPKQEPAQPEAFKKNIA